MAAFGRFLGAFTVLLASMLLAVLLAMFAGLMSKILMDAFLIGWEVL